LSPRKSKPLIKVNCAALPASLIESVLFGHERGSFTGATERRIGKFELADKGTIFLDEIGELPPEVQSKLLRVLQEKEVERLGSNDTIKVDVRIIAATNRHLEKEVAEGSFRMDLYYRLNAFPLTLPPLRERKEDIPLLTRHFIEGYCKKMGKAVLGISDSAMNELVNHGWPGNIRELENVIERTVLLTQDEKISHVALPATLQNESDTEHKVKTIEENEREHIIAVLRQCNGKIFVKGGAAEVLAIHASTLNSRMKKLGITRTKHIS
jgi:two-component system, NtrC family, response regulator HydG